MCTNVQMQQICNFHKEDIDSNLTQVRSNVTITSQTDLNPRLSARGNVFNSSLSVCPLFNIYRKENCNTHFVVNANINVLSHEYVSSPYCLFMHLFIHFSRLWICRDLVAGVALWEYWEIDTQSAHDKCMHLCLPTERVSFTSVL